MHKFLSYISVPFFYLLGGFFILYHMMGNILFELNDVQLDRSGDGFKNYFAFAWQYKHEDGLFFRGMQYPYGDLLAYADGQPLMTMLLVGLKKIGIDFSGYELLLVQGLPILSMAAGFYFLHKIIRNYQVPHWWSIITVIACVMLSPQVYRFNAHFALGYLFCFPSIWYLYIRYSSGRLGNMSYAIITSIALLAYAYLHPYHLLIGSSFVLGIFIVRLFYKKIDWPQLIAGLLPIILFLVINHLIDPYSDRPQNPWGAWHYKTEFSDLLPFYGWFTKLFSSIITLRNTYHEGYSYLGILMFLFPILYFFKRSKNNDSNDNSTVLPKVAIFSSLLVLLFSMGIHILITDHKILDWISALKQFRALGRFSWPFYYVGFISLSIYLYKKVSLIENKIIKIILFSFVIIMWMVDGLYYSMKFRKNMNQYKAPNELYTNLEIKNAINEKININDYQAILPLPVSMEGAEKLTPSDNWFTKTQGIPYAYQTGLPIIGAYMSRTSLSRILKQYQLGSSEYVKKTIIDDLPNKNSIITLIAKDDKSLYKDIAEKSTLLGETKYVLVYSTSINAFSKTKYITADSLVQSEPALLYDDYAGQNKEGLFSDGKLFVDGTEILADIDISNYQNDTLTLSTWYRIDADESSIANFHISIADDKQNTISDIHYRDQNVQRMEIIDNWVEIKQEVVLPKNAFQLKWTIKAENLYLDHTLITDQQKLFWYKLSDNYIIYDHYIAQTKETYIDTEN
ncbi:hypothetical protein N9L92_03575 [Saprospiraceae bacterium]|nr:hypothetical protein [Saprospiraceae bacterium]